MSIGGHLGRVPTYYISCIIFPYCKERYRSFDSSEFIPIMLFNRRGIFVELYNCSQPDRHGFAVYRAAVFCFL